MILAQIYCISLTYFSLLALNQTIEKHFPSPLEDPQQSDPFVLN